MDSYFNKNLKYLRIQKELSQEKLANMIGKDRSSIGYWEQGKADPSIENVIKIAEALNVPIYDLISTDLSVKSSVNDKNEQNELDELLFSKAKELSDEDKKMIIGVINAIKRDVDKENNN